MKRLISALVLSFIGISGLLFAETQMSAETMNEYGGKTVETAFEVGTPLYKNGLAKLILYLDGNDRRIKDEEYYTEEHARKDGVVKRVFYYDGNGKTMKFEEHYTGDAFRENGSAKIMGYVDSSLR